MRHCSLKIVARKMFFKKIERIFQLLLRTNEIQTQHPKEICRFF